MSDAPDGGRLSESEFRQFCTLMQRYCDYDIDQFECLKLSSARWPELTWYAQFTFERAAPLPPEGSEPPDFYISIDRFIG